MTQVAGPIRNILKTFPKQIVVVYNIENWRLNAQEHTKERTRTDTSLVFIRNILTQGHCKIKFLLDIYMVLITESNMNAVCSLFFFFRPQGRKTDAFYLYPRASVDGPCWYIDAPVDVHTLQQIVKNMCNEAGFEGQFTNHSLRATAATRLYAAGVDEQLITEKTGHCSSSV